MSQSLRQRIDNIEAFAADVTHELKNPLASLRSAVDGIDRVDDPDSSTTDAFARDDVLRLDRLINDIAEAARTDAELARATLRPVDLGAADRAAGPRWETRREKGDARIAFARPAQGQRRRSWASPTGSRGRSTTSRQCSQLLAARRVSRSPRRGSATRSGSASTTRARACRPKRAKRSLTASIRSGRKAKISADIPGSALRSPGDRRRP